MSIYKKFISGSGIYHPKTPDYAERTVEFFEDGKNRCVRVSIGYECLACIKINLNTANACRIHSVDTLVPEIFDWLDETCSIKSDDWWDYKHWNDVDKFMKKLVDYVKNN